MQSLRFALLWSLWLAGFIPALLAAPRLQVVQPAFTSTAAPVVPTSLLTAPQRQVYLRDGRRLNLVCLGSGAPTILFESGTGGGVFDWRFVQAVVARHTTACAYDRAGFGFSDPARRRSDVDNAVDDLHQLGERAALPRPLLLVGHSNGGMYAVRFAQQHRSEVAALVLVDPGFPGQQDFTRYGLAPARAAELEAGNAAWIRSAQHCLDLVRSGILALRASSPCLDQPPNADSALHRALNRIDSSPAYAAALLSEFQSTFRKRHGATVNDREIPMRPGSLGALPLTVLTASRHPAAPSDFTPADQAKYYRFWRAGHDRLAALSTCSRNRVVPDSGHFIQYNQPQVVIATILAALADAGRLAPATCRSDH
ncbi:alpha/beta fold hydrolase [Acidipila sp. EB88]|uniref:alpha/beta fold hydrolase n=1 Tax=Acidipila sp. EB88 TaxID=2305226 RepID=UPI000F601B54|nr:alpha/beta hydrolase [Acidipila sp. EB88]RRA48266.1 alpha/beta hydrolase [Acidipila sp. EB88]